MDTSFFQNQTIEQKKVIELLRSEEYKRKFKSYQLGKKEKGQIRDILFKESENSLHLRQIEPRLNELIIIFAEKKSKELQENYQRQQVWEENQKKEKLKKEHLFYNSETDEDIIQDIEVDMKNLASHEAGTKWMRIGTLISFDSTQQIIGAGLKALIDQNKILIKQNELLRRQNENIIQLLNKEK